MYVRSWRWQEFYTGEHAVKMDQKSWEQSSQSPQILGVNNSCLWQLREFGILGLQSLKMFYVFQQKLLSSETINIFVQFLFKRRVV